MPLFHIYLFSYKDQNSKSYKDLLNYQTSQVFVKFKYLLDVQLTKHSLCGLDNLILIY